MISLAAFSGSGNEAYQLRHPALPRLLPIGGTLFIHRRRHLCGSVGLLTDAGDTQRRTARDRQSAGCSTYKRLRSHPEFSTYFTYPCPRLQLRPGCPFTQCWLSAGQSHSLPTALSNEGMQFVGEDREDCTTTDDKSNDLIVRRSLGGPRDLGVTLELGPPKRPFLTVDPACTVAHISWLG